MAGSTSIAYIYSLVSFGFLAAGNLIDKSFFETVSVNTRSPQYCLFKPLVGYSDGPDLRRPDFGRSDK